MGSAAEMKQLKQSIVIERDVENGVKTLLTAFKSVHVGLHSDF